MQAADDGEGGCENLDAVAEDQAHDQSSQGGHEADHQAVHDVIATGFAGGPATGDGGENEAQDGAAPQAGLHTKCCNLIGVRGAAGLDGQERGVAGDN